MGRQFSGLLGLGLAAALFAACAHRSSEAMPPPRDPEIMPDERVGSDDVFEVRVLGEADLSGSYRVAEDGTIFFPYAGRIQVVGLRPGEIQQLLTQKLKDGYIRDPQITLAMSQWNSRKVSVLGQVNKPGPVSYFPRMTIVDAIAAAGGFTPVAATNQVRLRREANGRVETKLYRVSDISQGQSPNVTVVPGDMLYVEERFF